MRLKIGTVVLMILAGLLSSANAELIKNGNFEADGYANAKLNGEWKPISNWKGWIDDPNQPNKKGWALIDTVTLFQPGTPPRSTAIRLPSGESIYQTVSTSWDADSQFTLSFNASEVFWDVKKIGNGIYASIRSTSDDELILFLADLDGSHAGRGTEYPEWTTKQTFTAVVAGESLIARGAIPGSQLRVNFLSRSDSNWGTKRVNWLDNVSLTVSPK